MHKNKPTQQARIAVFKRGVSVVHGQQGESWENMRLLGAKLYFGITTLVGVSWDVGGLCLRQQEPWESSRIPDVWSQSFHHSSELLSVRLSPPGLGSSLASPALIVKIPLWPVAAINSDFCACWAAE